MYPNSPFPSPAPHLLSQTGSLVLPAEESLIADLGFCRPIAPKRRFLPRKMTPNSPFATENLRCRAETGSLVSRAVRAPPLEQVSALHRLPNQSRPSSSSPSRPSSPRPERLPNRSRLVPSAFPAELASPRLARRLRPSSLAGLRRGASPAESTAAFAASRPRFPSRRSDRRPTERLPVPPGAQYFDKNFPRKNEPNTHGGSTAMRVDCPNEGGSCPGSSRRRGKGSLWRRLRRRSEASAAVRFSAWRALPESAWR